MNNNYTTFREQVIYGLDSIDEHRCVEMKLKDVVLLHQLLKELHDFFQQPRHYPDIEDILQFVGDSEQGALNVISQAYLQILQDAIPVDIHREFAEAETFDNPTPPYYSIARIL